MPLNPSTIDRRGLQPLANANGSHDTDYPLGDKPVGEPSGDQITVTASEAGVASFGGGPNVVFFDRVEQPAGNDFNLSSPEIGSYDSIDLESGSTSHKYISVDGKSWIPTRDPDRVSSGDLALAKIRFSTPGSTQVFMSYRMTGIAGMIYPTATEAGQTAFPPDGNYKPLWASDPDNLDEIADIVVGSYGSGRVVAGNTNFPRKYTPTEGSLFFNGRYPTEGNPSVVGYYQSGDESMDGAHDADMEIITIDADGAAVTSGQGDPYHQANNAGVTVTKKIYDYYVINGQLGNVSTGWVNVQAGMDYIYIAEGANANARIMMANASTLSATTEAYIVPPAANDGWTEQLITTWGLVDREKLPYVHLFLPDGTLIENAKGAE